MESNQVVGFVTKYALKYGILRVKGDLVKHGKKKYISGTYKDGKPFFLVLNRDVFLSADKAHDRVKELLKVAIKNTKKLLATYQRATFEIVTCMITDDFKD